MDALPGYFCAILVFFLSFFKRENKLGRDRLRERERGRQRMPGRLHTVSAEPDAGLDLRNVGS